MNVLFLKFNRAFSLINGICRDTCSKVYLEVMHNLALGHFQGKGNVFSVKHATSNIHVPVLK